MSMKSRAFRDICRTSSRSWKKRGSTRMSGRSLVVVLSMIWAGAAGAEEIGNAENGAEIFDYCAACHEVGKGAENGIGPHLNGIFGRRAGAFGDDYAYSDSLARA